MVKFRSRGLPLMEAISIRASARDFLEKEVSLQDLSDLLWAADGLGHAAARRNGQG